MPGQFVSKYIYDQTDMKSTKVRDFLSLIGSRRKTSFNFYTGIMVCEKCKKIQMSRKDFCTRIHHFDQCWDSKIFNNQMDTKWKTSRIFGNYTSISFERAIAGPILTPGRHPKVACKQHYVFLHQHSPFFTSVGKVKFLTTKWTPNEKNQEYLEIKPP